MAEDRGPAEAAAAVASARPTRAPVKPTITRYEAVMMPRGNIVFEMPSRRVEASFATILEAKTHADQLNKWLASRPAADKRYRMFVPPAEKTEAMLIELIDQMYDPGALELELDALTAQAEAVEP